MDKSYLIKNRLRSGQPFSDGSEPDHRSERQGEALIGQRSGRSEPIFGARSVSGLLEFQGMYKSRSGMVSLYRGVWPTRPSVPCERRSSCSKFKEVVGQRFSADIDSFGPRRNFHKNQRGPSVLPGLRQRRRKGGRWCCRCIRNRG